MRKALAPSVIIGVLVIAVIAIIGFVVVPLGKPAGPDATHYKPPTADELAREHGMPPAKVHKK